MARGGGRQPILSFALSLPVCVCGFLCACGFRDLGEETQWVTARTVSSPREKGDQIEKKRKREIKLDKKAGLCGVDIASAPPLPLPSRLRLSIRSIPSHPRRASYTNQAEPSSHCCCWVRSGCFGLRCGLSVLTYPHKLVLSFMECHALFSLGPGNTRAQESVGCDGLHTGRDRGMSHASRRLAEAGYTLPMWLLSGRWSVPGSMTVVIR